MTQTKITELLLAARCPDPGCDGFGTVQGVEERNDDLGDNLHALYDVDTSEPCQWCHGRAQVLGRPDLLEGKPNIKTGKPMLEIDAARLSDPEYRDELNDLGLGITTNIDDDIDNELPI